MGITAKVNFNSKDLGNLIKIELSSPDNAKLNKAFSEQLSRYTSAIVGTGVGKPDSDLASAVKEIAVDVMEQGLLDISLHLKQGISKSDPLAKGWDPLSKQWKKRKVPQSRNLFWKNTGALSTGFTTFKHYYMQSMRSSKVVVKGKTISAVYGKRKFQYSISISLPSHQEEFINKIIRDSFLTGVAHSGMGFSKSQPGHPNTFGKIGFMEGEGQSHRPFMAKLMAARGRQYQRLVRTRLSRVG
jgi:hypothetical protein